LRGSRT
jgi:hypothetical protein